MDKLYFMFHHHHVELLLYKRVACCCCCLLIFRLLSYCCYIELALDHCLDISITSSCSFQSLLLADLSFSFFVCLFILNSADFFLCCLLIQLQQFTFSIISIYRSSSHESSPPPPLALFLSLPFFKQLYSRAVCYCCLR